MEQEVGDGWIEGVHPEDRNRCLQTYLEAFSLRKPFKTECRLRRYDGQYRWMVTLGTPLRDRQGKFAGYIGSCYDVTDYKRASAHETGQLAVMRLLAESRALSDAIPQLLRFICQAMDWDLGELWLVDTPSKMLRWAGSWHALTLDAGEFEAVSREVTFPPGSRLPGRVWATGQPSWMTSLGTDPNFPRGRLAADLGLASTFAFPIRNAGEVIGVMTFFGRDPRQPDEKLRQVMADIGQQIGKFIGRNHADAALQENHWLLEEVAGALDGSIVLTDVEGRILLFNRACEELTGYRREEVIGKPIFEFFAPRDRGRFIQQCLPTIQNYLPINAPDGAPRLPPPRPIPCCVSKSGWITKSGQERLIQWRFSTLTLEDGKRCLLAIGLDASNSAQLQEQTRELSRASQTAPGRPSRPAGEMQEPAAVGFHPSQTPFIGESSVTTNVLTLAHKLSALDSTVLITGESGVGKGLIARIIHQSGPRAKGPFVTVSCTGLPSELVESELFGHERGAYTGAHEKRLGRVEHASGGTLFLDEVGDLPLELQPKLLNFLQDRTFTRLGSSKTIFVDVRIVAATNQDLQALCKQRRFRADLYFRLNVLPIQIQPLRNRKEDIPALINYILKRISRHRQCPPFMVTDGAMEALLRYDWPGNVRELENVLERSTAFCSDMTIARNDLPAEIMHKPAASAVDALLDGLSLAEIERAAILRTLELCGGSRSQAAKLLGISEKTIYNKLRQRHNPFDSSVQ